MNDADLRTRFRELREEDQRHVPAYVERRASARRRSLGLIPAVAVLLLVAILIGLAARRPRPQTSFSPADARAARAISAWRAPTDALLRPPGSELLTSLPSIPSKGLQP